MKQVEIISSSDEEILQNNINVFLQDPSVNLVDVKYISDTGLKQALIIYEVV